MNMIYEAAIVLHISGSFDSVSLADYQQVSAFEQAYFLASGGFDDCSDYVEMMK